MTDDDEWGLIDGSRTICLCANGSPGYVATVAIAADGSESLVLAQIGLLGDESAVYDASCPEATHDQLGELPLDTLKRIAIAQRKGRSQ